MLPPRFFQRIGVSRQRAASKHTPEATGSKWRDTDARTHATEDLLRLEHTAKLGFTVRMTASGLGTEVKKGRLAICRIGKDSPLSLKSNGWRNKAVSRKKVSASTCSGKARPLQSDRSASVPLPFRRSGTPRMPNGSDDKVRPRSPDRFATEKGDVQTAASTRQYQWV
jgi:hypothetical protein